MNTIEKELICVSNRECNLYHDSYFYATFFDEKDSTFKEVMIGSTAFANGAFSYKINASDDILELYYKHLEIEAAKREALIPRVGKRCTITRSKKYKDQIGTIAYIGKSPYDSRIIVATVNMPNWYTTTVDISRIVLTDI